MRRKGAARAAQRPSPRKLALLAIALYALALRVATSAGAVDVLILDLFRVGGITPWRKAAALAEEDGLHVGAEVVADPAGDVSFEQLQHVRAGLGVRVAHAGRLGALGAHGRERGRLLVRVGRQLL